MSTEHPRILVVDDHLDMAETVADGLCDRGYDAFAVDSGREAAVHLQDDGVDALVTDLRMPDGDGLQLLALSRSLDPTRPVIVMTAFSAIETAVESIRRGAYHYVTKPFRSEELALFLGRALDEVRVRREAQALRATLKERFSLGSVVGKSEAMRAVYDLIERIKDAAVPVLITGETGTGKGLVARALHSQSTRAARPFVAVNCASLPEALLESELFGHAKGAFTGATSNRPGLFAEADGGTLLLDEIGEMTPALQAKLLHVLEVGTVRAVGATKEREVDVRVVAATHRDLRERIRRGAFREDLFYRLDGVTLELPALRHRLDDIPLLIEHFLAAAKARAPESRVERLSADATARMMDYGWPGNVRELAHVVGRLVLLGRSPEVQVAELPESLRTPAPPRLPSVFDGSMLPIRDVQRQYAAWALEQMRGHKTRTAEVLGVDLKTLSKWLSPGVT